MRSFDLTTQTLDHSRLSRRLARRSVSPSQIAGSTFFRERRQRDSGVSRREGTAKHGLLCCTLPNVRPMASPACSVYFPHPSYLLQSGIIPGYVAVFDGVPRVAEAWKGCPQDRNTSLRATSALCMYAALWTAPSYPMTKTGSSIPLTHPRSLRAPHALTPSPTSSVGPRSPGLWSADP
jgi:hypothetical protein